MTMGATTSPMSLIEEAIGGLSAGIVGTVIGYPLDVIKTRMQTNNSSDGAAIKVSSTTTTAATKLPIRTTSSRRPSILGIGYGIVQREGFLSLYKGIGPPLFSLSLLNTINFTSYSYFQQMYHSHRGWDVRNGLAGATCGPIASSISTIENLIKTQMQLDAAAVAKTTTSNTRTPPNKKSSGSAPTQYRHSWHCVQTLVREHGISILYMGHGINTAREMIFLSTYFFVYEGLRQELLDFVVAGQQGATIVSSSSRTSTSTNTSSAAHQRIVYHQNQHSWAIPIAGGCAGAVAWIVSFPLDCIRAVIQGQDLRPSFNTSNGNGSSNSRSSHSATSYHRQPRPTPFQLFQQLWITRGVRGLYAGVGPSIVRAFLVSGSRFSAYEFTLWILRGGRDVVNDRM